MAILSFRKDLLQLGAGSGVLLTQDPCSLFGGSILMQSSQIQLPQLAAFTKHSLPGPVLILQFILRVTPDFVFLCSPLQHRLHPAISFLFLSVSLTFPTLHEKTVVVSLGSVCTQFSVLPKAGTPDLLPLQQCSQFLGHLFPHRVSSHSPCARLYTGCYMEAMIFLSFRAWNLGEKINMHTKNHSTRQWEICAKIKAGPVVLGRG